MEAGWSLEGLTNKDLEKFATGITQISRAQLFDFLFGQKVKLGY